MHHHLEIILPPTDNVEAAIAEILAPFCENQSDANEDRNSNQFWDWYVIGGRWAGNKLLQTIGKDKIAAFYEVLHAERVTVSGLQAGKPTLSPPGQEEKVDRLWNKSFPNLPIKCCPLFDNYKENYWDIASFSDLSGDISCSHLIIAGLDWKKEKLEATFALQERIWNGTNFQEITWDGTLGAALALHEKSLKNYKEEYANERRPKADWLVVTVDYHS